MLHLDKPSRRSHKPAESDYLLPFVDELSAQLEAGGHYRMAGVYTGVARKFVAFNEGRDIPVERLHARLIRRFETSLYESGHTDNTVSYYLRNLRAIYHKAVGENRPAPRDHPFKLAFTASVRTQRPAPTRQQARQLCELQLEHYTHVDRFLARATYRNNLQRSLWLYIFCHQARGMSFVDLAFLKKEDVRKGMIVYTPRLKTKPKRVPLTGGMQTIIDRFARETAESPYLFPIVNGSGAAAYSSYKNALRQYNRHLNRLRSLLDLTPRDKQWMIR